LESKLESDGIVKFYLKQKPMKQLIILITLISFHLFAEDIDWSKYETEKDLDGLSVQQLKRIPLSEFQRIMYKEGATAKLFSEEGMEYLIHLQLSSLGYFNDINSKLLKQKIKSFQETIGDEPTGEFTYGQFDKLNQCVTKHREAKVLPLGSTFISINDDYAYAKASLVIDDGNDTYLQPTDSSSPITHSIIQCDRKDELCRVFTADMKIPSYGDSSSTYNLFTDVNSWSIDSWSSDKITASTIGFNTCRNTTMTMNSTSNEIVQLTTNNNKEGCDVMGVKTKLDRPQVVKSVDPFKYSYGYWSARTKKTSEMCLSNEIKELAKDKLGVNN